MSLICSNPARVIDARESAIIAILDRALNVYISTSVTQEVVQGLRGIPDCKVALIEGQSANYNTLIHGTLTRACVYVACWLQAESTDSVTDFLAKMDSQNKPWNKASVVSAYPPRSRKRGVRDFDVGSLVGGHANSTPSSGLPFATTPPPKLDGLEHFSRELLILESLLPIYLENT